MGKDRTIDEYRKLGSRKYRKKSGKIILEGYHLLAEALNAGIDIETILYTEEFTNRPINRELLARAGQTKTVKISPRIFKAVAQTENPQGIGAIARLPHPKTHNIAGKGHLYLFLDGIQDPGNLGTIIRTAAGAAVDGIFLLPGTVEPCNPKVLRASMGGIFYLPVLPVDKIERSDKLFKNRGFQLVAADPRGDTPYYGVDFTRPSAIIIGNENRGVDEKILKKADVRAYIPLKGKIAALNAAVAASVFIFESRRQRPEL